MKGKETLVTLAALVAIALTAVVAYKFERKPDAEICAICNRMTHGTVAYRLEVGSRTEHACCPRCGMHYAIQHEGSVKQAWATDLNSGKSIPAESAVYVEGGDVEYCTHDMQAVQREPEGMSVRGYDRCLPTLVAFRSRDDADAYQKQHGGRVLDYAQALESVRTH